MSSGDRADDLFNPKRRQILQQATAAAGGLTLAAASYPFPCQPRPKRARPRPRRTGRSRFLAAIPGELATVEWRGKPVWILRRTQDMLTRLETARTQLADPDSEVSSQQPGYARNAARSARPELFVTVALCTHLGCIPSYRPESGSLQPGWPGGFYCPCHGSKFDLAGRVFKGSPAPTNLVVPPYSFESPERLVVGRDSEGDAK